MRPPAPETKKSNNLLLIAAGILIGLGAGLVLFFLLGPGRAWINRLFTQSSLIPPSGQVENVPAPAFQLKTLDGKTVSLADMKGKTVLLNFWATWCGPCQQEMPLLQDAQNKYSDRLEILAINNDEAPEKIQPFLDRLGLKLTVLLDPGAKVTQQYRVRGFPTTLVIDPQGIIRYQHIGQLSQEMLNGYLKQVGVTE